MGLPTHSVIYSRIQSLVCVVLCFLTACVMVLLQAALGISSLLAVYIAWYFHRAIPLGAAAAVKEICSGVFLSHRVASDIMREDIAPTNMIAPFMQVFRVGLAWLGLASGRSVPASVS